MWSPASSIINYTGTSSSSISYFSPGSCPLLTPCSYPHQSPQFISQRYMLSPFSRSFVNLYLPPSLSLSLLGISLPPSSPLPCVFPYFTPPFMPRLLLSLSFAHHIWLIVCWQRPMLWEQRRREHPNHPLHRCGGWRQGRTFFTARRGPPSVYLHIRRWFVFVLVAAGKIRAIGCP